MAGNSIGRYYGDYVRWKGWDEKFTYTNIQNAYFTKEFGRYAKPGTRVLEIGFGAGSFLAWAKNRGCQIAGVEIQSELVEEARRQGFSALTFSEIESDQQYDLIVGISVLEHLTDEDLRELLKRVENCLSPNGRAIFRVPNGMSPFGRVHQHGDLTHLQSISPSLLTQLISLHGVKLDLVSARNPATPVGLARGPIYVSLNIFRLAFRWMLYTFLSAIIVGMPRVLDPNIILELRRQS